MSSSNSTYRLQLAPPRPRAPHQLNMVFESSLIQGMSPTERFKVVSQLAILLLQAAGVQQQEGDDHGEH